jgi:hypothetical protein
MLLQKQEPRENIGVFHFSQKNIDVLQTNVVRERHGKTLHLLLSLCTLGAWVIVWILASAKIGGWRCPNCGTKVSWL